MEILDKVYNTFKNLERDYSHSKKSRSDFIKGKFGGDIDIGSTIILDAVSADADDNNPKDIEKLTFIKDIFASIKESKATLDTMTDFSFNGGSTVAIFKSILSKADRAGRGVMFVSQKDIQKKSKSDVHFVATPDCLMESDYMTSKVFHIYEGNGPVMYELAFGKKAPEPESYLYAKNHITHVPIARKDITQYLK